MKEMKHTDRLLNEVRTLIKENNIQDGELYIGHFLRFFAQCKHDEIFRLAKVEWDAENKDFDIWWDTKLQDSVCSICPLWFNFRIWIGEDSHKKTQSVISGEWEDVIMKIMKMILLLSSLNLWKRISSI